MQQEYKKQIIAFVQQKPRTVQEIAELLKKNWRTADRYIDQIEKEDGSIATRTFRPGSRGALKLVYYNNTEKITASEFQERITQKILNGRKKEDFSPLDIIQYVDKEKRKAFLETQHEEFATLEQDIVGLLSQAQEQVLIFSGNLSWATAHQQHEEVIMTLAHTAQRGVSIKILSRIDVASINNYQKVQHVNELVSKNKIEVRHAEQPLRAIIIDNKIARLKEIKQPQNYKRGELKKTTYIFYDIYEEEWIEFLKKIFWHIFATAPPAEKRKEIIDELEDKTLFKKAKEPAHGPVVRAHQSAL